jgi:Domain of unknown function (DUF4397)
MKNITSIVWLFALQLIAISCHKSSGGTSSPASLNIINAIPTSQPIIPVLGTTDTIQYFDNAPTVSYGSSQLYSPLSGRNSLYIVQFTDTLQINSKVDMFSGTLNLHAGGIYSFFLTGDTTAVDTFFVQDQIPAYSDSTAGVRFVNLSPGSGTMTVNLQGNPASQTEFTNLGYKQISAFKAYPANSSVPGNYTFVVHDPVSGDSVVYTWGYSLYKNNTIVIAGSENPSSSDYPINAFQVNNF